MRRDIAQVLAMTVLLISSAVVMSYVMEAPQLREWSDPPMAVNTALCLFILSVAFGLIASDRLRK